jgi:hypothetical protein
MPRFASHAEYCRHHRKVMELALELRCTPIEAERRMKEVEERERHRARMARKGLQSALPPLSLRPEQPQPATFDQFDARWMMRD